MNTNRLLELAKIARKYKLNSVMVFDRANILAMTGVDCDSACLMVQPTKNADGFRACFFTDFRYVPMVHRVAPWLMVKDIRRLKPIGSRIGFEGSISYNRYEALKKTASGARFVDVKKDVDGLRMVKTDDELDRLRSAAALNDMIWKESQAQFRPGMTEREMANVIRHLMIENGDGEAFATIVCVGKNAAECHHVPDDTVWKGTEPILVDMGVKLDGVCSDMTRNIVPRRVRPIYRQIYNLVLEANLAAIAAARPGITGKALDKVARDVIRKGGFGNCFGHSLGHGVGYEIHEAPTASRRDDTVLEPGMSVTIEPGVYLEGNLGVRIEDLIVINDTGCEVLTSSGKKLG